MSKWGFKVLLIGLLVFSVGCFLSGCANTFKRVEMTDVTLDSGGRPVFAGGMTITDYQGKLIDYQDITAGSDLLTAFFGYDLERQQLSQTHEFESLQQRLTAAESAGRDNARRIASIEQSIAQSNSGKVIEQPDNTEQDGNTAAQSIPSIAQLKTHKYIWKPAAHREGTADNGNLALLFSPKPGRVMVNDEVCRYTKPSNGFASTYYCSKPGRDYPAPAILEIDGVKYRVDKPGSRYERR